MVFGRFREFAMWCALLALVVGWNTPVVAAPPAETEWRGVDDARVTGTRGPRVLSLRPQGPWRDADAWLRAAAARTPLFAGATLLRENRLGVLDVRLRADVDPAAATRALTASGACEFVEIASPIEWLGVPDDPGFVAQWHLHNTGQSGGVVGADVAAAWAFEIADGDPEIVIAMIDSRVDTDHPELARNLLRNPNEIPGNGVDDDQNGFVDDVAGVDFALEPGSAETHGTAVAGVIAAAGNNRLGVAGLAGGGRDGEGCTLLAIGIGAGDAEGSAIDDAILHAIDRGARVVCLALAVQPSRAIDLALDAARAADVLVVAGAGNRGRVSYPAAHPWVIAVAGTDRSDRAAGFSAGPEVSLAAPAVDVFTTFPGGAYGVVRGTSFAAPQVAALAGLILSTSPELAAAQVRSILERSARDVEGTGRDDATGAGRIDAWRALRLARAAIPPRIDSHGSAGPPLGGNAPVITTNGAPALAGDDEFAIVLAGAAPSRRAWLLLGQELADARSGVDSVLFDPTARIVAAYTDARGECEIRGLLTARGLAPGRRLLAQWVVDAPGLPASSRVLAVTIGD